jgi:ribosomal protein S17E
MMNGKEMTSSFDLNGKWLETETEISSKDLPAAVTATLAREFAAYKTGEMSIIENPEMKGFEIALKKDKSAVEVVIDASGKVLKNTAVTKKADKD